MSPADSYSPLLRGNLLHLYMVSQVKVILQKTWEVYQVFQATLRIWFYVYKTTVNRYIRDKVTEYGSDIR